MVEGTGKGMVMEVSRAGKAVSSRAFKRPGDLSEAQRHRAGKAHVFRRIPEANDMRLPVELSAFEGLLPRSFLMDVQRRARALGVGGDEVLRCGLHVGDDEAAEAMARHLGLPLVGAVEHLAPPGNAAPGAVADWAKGLLRTGVHAALDGEGRVVFTIAASGRSVSRLARALRVEPSLRARVRLIAPGALRRQVMREAGGGIAHDAAFAWRDEMPSLSAGTLDAPRLLLILLAAIVVTGATAATVSGTFSLLALQALLSMVFLSWSVLRLAGCCFSAIGGEAEPDFDDRQLPVYSLLVPLYKEAASVPRLITAMRALDYPPEKLDIKLVVEADDAETRAAIAAVGLPGHMEEVVVPQVGPRTKPKALNMALTFARGTYVAVYDAEDQPEEDQLKRALAAFRRGGPDVACVQARLCVDNGAEGWISGHFAAEYAGQFDVLLPVLSALDMPILLGGTSNHFRRDILEEIGGWDSFNVTEDAELGIRLARAGWRTEVIASTTYEEAPASVGAWLGQRTRWLKGWAQTLLVQGRRPQALVHELGWGAATAMVVLTAGPFTSALLHPLCMGLLVWHVLQGDLLAPCTTWAEVGTSALTYVSLLVGYVGAGLTVATGLLRRGERPRMGMLWSIPIYWLLLSVAAWRAMIELARRPYHWEKTAHGMSTRRSMASLRTLRSSA